MGGMGGGRADSTTDSTTDSGAEQSVGPSLFGRPGARLAAAVEAAVNPVSGLVPAGFLPAGDSTEPWAEAIHAVVAARRLQGWLLWAQLSLLARWAAAWRARPPVSNALREPDRCESSNADLAARVNQEISRIERQLGGRFAPMWGSDPHLPVQLAPYLVAAELGLAAGLSRTVCDQHVEAAEALFTDDRLPRLARFLEAGWVDWPKVQTFVHATTALDPVVAHAVERIVLGDPLDHHADPAGEVDVLLDPSQPGLGLPVITRMTLPQLRAAIEAAIAAIDAEAAARRARQARSARRVRSRATGEGTATLTVDVTVEAAAAVWNALTEAAKTARAGGDPRCLDQLRADILVARATTSPMAPPLPGDTLDDLHDDDAETLGDIHASGDPDDLARLCDHQPRPSRAASEQTQPTQQAQQVPAQERTDADHSSDPARAADASRACRACGQQPGQARARRTGAPLTVNLTLPLSAYLRLTEDPGELDGYGPVAAGLARQIIHENSGSNGITWRCVVTDDTHGTVLGVGSPIHVARHDPPARLADLVRTGEPTCCFPGCRTRARDCDLDHRIPYDTDDPAGERGGGATCSCNLGPLCRTHHRLKTAGLLGIRRLPDESGTPPGTLEFTTSTGLRYHRAPHRAAPAPPDLDDPLVATALAHTGLQGAQRAIDEARIGGHYAAIHPPRTDRAEDSGTDAHEYDGEDRAWRASLAAHSRATTGTRDSAP